MLCNLAMKLCTWLEFSKMWQPVRGWMYWISKKVFNQSFYNLKKYLNIFEMTPYDNIQIHISILYHFKTSQVSRYLNKQRRETFFKTFLDAWYFRVTLVVTFVHCCLKLYVTCSNINAKQTGAFVSLARRTERRNQKGNLKHSFLYLTATVDFKFYTWGLQIFH